jgi:hypothetical protein
MRALAVLSLLIAANVSWAQSLGDFYSWFDDHTGEPRPDREILEQAAERQAEWRAQRSAADDAVDAARVDALEKGLNLSLWGVGTAVSGRELFDEWSALDDAEAYCGSAYNDKAAPVVPSKCAENQKCSACYAEVVRQIDFNRFYLERAHCITSAAVKMANSAMAFGDSTSGIHAVTGLAWQREGKPQIEGAVRELRETYRRKSQDYLRELERSMRKMGECEADFYDSNDWYDRYGWLYISFLQSRYQTPP